MKCVCLLVCAVIVLCSNLAAETNVHHQLYLAGQLDRQGKFSQAVEEILPIIHSDLLEEGERGRAWILLGFAYLEQGEYMQAESAYERAVQIFSDNPKYEEDYATALDNFAQLYRETRKQKEAAGFEKRALDIYRKLNRHAAAARVLVNLATIEFKEKHRRRGQQYLSEAIEEAKADGNLDDDFFASISSMQAWLSELDGKKDAAVSGYQQAIALWQKKHGEEHMLTGLGYMLLGNAFVHAGQETAALDSMRRGLDILDRTVGSSNLKYLEAELTYSRLLDHMGEHAEAARLKNTAEQQLTQLYRIQCVDCRISAAMFH